MATAFLTIFLALCLVPSNSNAYDFDGLGFTGNEFKKWTPNEQNYYIAGFMDSMNVWAIDSAMHNYRNSLGFRPSIHKFTACINKWTPAQTNASVKKWMENNPEKWHFNINHIIWLMLQDVCKHIPTKD